MKSRAAISGPWGSWFFGSTPALRAVSAAARRRFGKKMFENFQLTFKIFKNYLMKFFARLFFVVAPIFLWLFCWGVSMEGATGCLRAARFARNFFEKSFESLPRMIKSSTRLGVGQFFFRNSGAGGCGRALQMFRVCVFPGASRATFLKKVLKAYPESTQHD